MTNLNPNSSNNPLAQNASFVGEWQLTEGNVAITVNLNCNSLALVTIQQSLYKNGAFIDNTQTSSYPVPTVAETYQVPVALNYFRVIVQNVDIIDQTFCRLRSFLTNTITHGVDIRKLSAFADSDNVEIIAKDGTGTLRHVLCDANGALITTHSNVVAQDVNVLNFPASQNVVVTSQPHLSYLTDNVAVSTMPSITGTVAVSSQPYLSYLNDNVAVATMPAITGTVAVSSQPHLSYLLDNVAVATQPALAFSTDKVDVTGSSVVVSSGSVTEINSGTISSTLTTLNGKVTACNTGAVTIASQSKTTSSITTWENPSSVISFDKTVTTVQEIKGSAGSLMSLSAFNDSAGNAIAFLALYDSLAANVTVGVTIPKCVIALNHNVTAEIPCHNLQFSTGISYYIATTYGGAINSATVYLTAFYDS